MGGEEDDELNMDEVMDHRHFYIFAPDEPFWMVKCTAKGYTDEFVLTFDGGLLKRTAIKRAVKILSMGWSRPVGFQVVSAKRTFNEDVMADLADLKYTTMMPNKAAHKAQPRKIKHFERPRDMDQELLDLIRTREGLTERELAKAIFGPDGYQQQVNQVCRRLRSQGLVERRGKGGARDPYKYYPIMPIKAADKARPQIAKHFKRPEDMDQELLDLVRTREGLTERELAKAIFGPDGYQQQVNQVCKRLRSQGLVERRGKGGARDPYKYYPIMPIKAADKTRPQIAEHFKRPKGMDQELLDLVRTREGLTERELAKAIFGPDGYQQQVNQVCRRLWSQGLVERRGEGGKRDPYRYYIGTI